MPSHVPSKVLGVVFDSSVFPSHNGDHKSGTRLTVSSGMCFLCFELHVKVLI